MSQKPTFESDALRVSLLFDYAVIKPTDVTEWADAQIIALQSVPDRLIELSTTPPDRTADIVSHLHELGQGGNFLQAFRACLGELHQYLVSSPHECERIANILYRTICEHNDLPQEFNFLYRYDDGFALARENVYGDFATLRHEFINDLARFAPAQPAKGSVPNGP